MAASAAACTDRATSPTSPSELRTPANNATTSTSDRRSSAPATLAWAARGRALVLAHPATMSPIVATRAYGLMGMTMYGAAVAADRSLGITDADGDRSTVTGADEGGRAQYEARRGAIGAASARILSYLFPDAVDAIKAQLAAEGIGANGRTHPQFTRGVRIGEAVGTLMVEWGKADGLDVTWTNPPFTPWLPGTPGRWYQTPGSLLTGAAGFQFPGMRPYMLRSNDQFRPAPPPAYLSPAFNAGLKVVRDISDTRTAEQTAIANFWNFSVGTTSTLGYWDERAAEYIAQHDLGERSAAHVFALTNAAVLDATIGCWDAKYQYGLLRPTQADGGITLVFPLPNHPSYPSGHSCLSAAAVTVLSAFFPEKAAELETGLTNAGLSRIYAGIHYPFDISAGQALGRSAGAWALDYDRRKGVLHAVGQE